MPEEETTTNDVGGELRLFVEPLPAGEAGENGVRDVAELEVISIPAGATTLEVDQGIRFEALTLEGRAALAMVTSPERRVRVNGAGAPLVSVLRIGDQVQLDDCVLHVTYMRRPRVGAPPAGLVGKPCGLCSVPFTATSTVVAHDCNTYLHLEPEDPSTDEALQCALLGCPTCNEPVVLDEGYTYEPEL
jgi:hypothetical protein